MSLQNQALEGTAGQMSDTPEPLSPNAIRSIQRIASESPTPATEPVAATPNDETSTVREHGTTGVPAETAPKVETVARPISPDPLTSATQGLSPDTIRSIQGK